MSVATKGILETLLSDPGSHHIVICNTKIFSECYMENIDFLFVIFTPNTVSFKMSHPARRTSNLRAEHQDFVRMSLGAKSPLTM